MQQQSRNRSPNKHTQGFTNRHVQISASGPLAICLFFQFFPSFLRCLYSIFLFFVAHAEIPSFVYVMHACMSCLIRPGSAKSSARKAEKLEWEVPGCSQPLSPEDSPSSYKRMHVQLSRSKVCLPVMTHEFMFPPPPPPLVPSLTSQAS